MDKCNPNQSCYKYCDKNACNLKLKTENCDPGNRDLWFKNKLPEGLDPVLSNIYNGCWSCNHEPMQSNNNKLCNRQFMDLNVQPPYAHIELSRREFSYDNNGRYCINRK